MPSNPFPNSVVVSMPSGSFAGGQLQNGFGGPGSTSSPGSRILYVNSSSNVDSSGNAGTDPLYPLTTLNDALTKTLNNNGDVIFVGPGHIETVSAAGGLTFPAATAIGVTVIFLGNETDRAQILFSATASTMTMVANNVTLVNPRFVCGIDAVAAPIVITGTDNKIINAEYFDAAVKNTLIQVITTNACKRLSIYGYRYYEDKTGGGTQKTECIRIVGGDHHRFDDMHVTGDFSTAPWNNITTLSTELLFNRCTFNSLNATPKPAMAILTTSTGMANAVNLTIASGATWITASNKLSFDGASNACIPGGVFAHPNG